MRRNLILIVLIAFLPLLGCAKKRTLEGGSVSGTITYKSQPVNGAMLRLYSTEQEKDPFTPANLSIPTINTSQEGKFSATGIPPGEYKIVVEPSAGPPGGMSGGMPPMPKGADPAKMEEMRKMKARIQKDMPVATIKIPDKYKKQMTTDLKVTIAKGDNTLNLELKD